MERKRLSFDELEHRDLTSVTFVDGALTILGDATRNVITVRQSHGAIVVGGNSGTGTFQDVRSIFIDSGPGNDHIDFRGVILPAEIEAHGGEGDDRIFGTAAARVFGEAGNDFYYDGWLRGQGHWDGGGGYDCNADIWTDGYSHNDVRQSARGTCSYLSALSAWIAKGGRPQIRHFGNGLYDVRIGLIHKRVVFVGFVYADAYSPVKTEFWVALAERAWMQVGYPWGAAWADEAWYAITRRNSEVRWGYPGTDLVQWVRSGLAAGQFVSVGTKESGYVSPKLIAFHAFWIVREDRGGVWARNPWGLDGAKVPSGDPDDGYVWVSWGQLRASIDYASRG